MRLATQQDLDTFYDKSIFDINIYPYLSTSTYISKPELPKDDWSGIYLVSEDLRCLLKISIDRTRDIEFNISLYSFSSFLAGKAIIALKEIIRRYKPKAINSVVHSSNIKSLKLHHKYFGKPWGIEPVSAYNMGLGSYEDLHYFRMLF